MGNLLDSVLGPAKIVSKLQLWGMRALCAGLLASTLWFGVNYKVEQVRYTKLETAYAKLLKDKERLVAEVKAKTEAAKKIAKQRAEMQEAVYRRLTTETNDEIKARIEAAVRAARADAMRLRRQVGGTEDRDSGAADLSRIARAPGNPDGAGATAIGDGEDRSILTVELSEEDLRICVTNTIKAEGWQTWYSRVLASQLPVATEPPLPAQPEP